MSDTLVAHCDKGKPILRHQAKANQGRGTLASGTFGSGETKAELDEIIRLGLDPWK